MSQPIYHLYFGKPTEAWYLLSDEEQTQLLARLREHFVSLGGETIITCDSAWATDQWQIWGVEKYPDLESLQKQVKFQRELKWLRYVDSTSILGTSLP